MFYTSKSDARFLFGSQEVAYSDIERVYFDNVETVYIQLGSSGRVLGFASSQLDLIGLCLTLIGRQKLFASIRRLNPPMR